MSTQQPPKPSARPVPSGRPLSVPTEDAWEVRPQYRRILVALRDVIDRATSLRTLLGNAGDLLHALLDAERITIWARDERTQQLSSIARTGAQQTSVTLPRSMRSIPGFVCLTGRTVVLRDAYSTPERLAVHAELSHDPGVDRTTGSRTRQVLAAAIPGLRGPLGVIEFVNSLDGNDFQADDVRLAEEAARIMGAAMLRLQGRAAPPRITAARFGALVNQGTLGAEALEQAEGVARATERDLAAVLIEAGISREVLGRCLAEFFGVRFFNYDGAWRIPHALRELFQPGFMRNQMLAPVEQRPDGTLRLVMEDPSNLEIIDALKQRRLATNLELFVGLRDEIVAYIDAGPDAPGSQPRGMAPVLDPRVIPPVAEAAVRRERDGTEIQRLLALVQAANTAVEPVGDDALDDPGDQAREPEAITSRLLRQIVLDAAARGASDVHIEPNGQREPCRVRFRIDGDCMSYVSLPPTWRNNLVQRIKVLADLDIAERRRPQDGRFRVRGPQGSIEVRIATLPTVGENEDITLRLLSSFRVRPLEDLDLSPPHLARFREMIAAPYGIVLVVGPTGSGKTSTLHAAVGALNHIDRKCLTVEDPVEIVQPGLRQVQVNQRINLGFPEVLRAFLRSDPDVILVGEMRDRVTASIAIEASLTGHLVLSTLQANSAAETIPRLLSMDLDAFLISDALRGIVAQRLVRKLCHNCRQATPPTPGEWDAIANAYGPDAFNAWLGGLDDAPQVWRAAGCDDCYQSGYHGRVPIHEVLPGTEHVKALVRARAPLTALRQAAADDGMTTMLQDGIQKMLTGQTDWEQVRANCVL
jgi:type II secretory ATPase GspE/PulE/Tfp pilus assembly ATPase PilB-like protein